MTTVDFEAAAPTFPLAELPAALALSETGHDRGKIAVTGAEAP